MVYKFFIRWTFSPLLILPFCKIHYFEFQFRHVRMLFASSVYIFSRTWVVAREKKRKRKKEQPYSTKFPRILLNACIKCGWTNALSIIWKHCSNCHRFDGWQNRCVSCISPPIMKRNTEKCSELIWSEWTINRHARNQMLISITFGRCAPFFPYVCWDFLLCVEYSTVQKRTRIKQHTTTTTTHQYQYQHRHQFE